MLNIMGRGFAPPSRPFPRATFWFLYSCCAVFLADLVAAIPAIGRHLHTHIRLNTTPSLPVGFYVPSTSAESNLTSFCLPQPWGTLALVRHYRTGSGDECPDGGEPLLKRIVARSGDLVSESESGVAVNGVPIPMSKPLPLDSFHRPLQPFMIGDYRLKDGEVWVMGEMPKSFDSRYYGPISTRLILGYLKAGTTWK